jgi:syntaxin-binding protein 1
MVKAMKEMPKYKAMMRQYHKHMSLASECMQKYEKQKLHDLGELEQDIATGLTESGDKVNMKTVKTSLVNMCQNPEINLIDKLRLLMIYIIAQGSMQESTRKELMAGISIRLQKAIRNLEKLGVDLSVQLAKNKSRHSKARLQEFEKRNKTIPLALMRFVPLLQAIFNNLVTGQLSEDEFPFISPPPENMTSRPSSSSKAANPRKTKSNWRGKKQTEAKDEVAQEDNRGRYLCFIAGGMTFSELRSAYEVAEQNNVNLYIGSTSTITARDFIRGLAELNENDDLSDPTALDDDDRKKKETKC